MPILAQELAIFSLKVFHSHSLIFLSFCEIPQVDV